MGDLESNPSSGHQLWASTSLCLSFNFINCYCRKVT